MNPSRVTYNTRQQTTLEEPQDYLEGTNTHFQHYFQKFLYNFSSQNIRIYHRQIETQLQKGRRVLTIHLAHLKAFEDLLYDRIVSSPLEMLKLMEEATRDYIKARDTEFPFADDQEWQIALRSDEFPRRLR